MNVHTATQKSYARATSNVAKEEWDKVIVVAHTEPVMSYTDGAMRAETTPEGERHGSYPGTHCHVDNDWLRAGGDRLLL